MKNYNIAIEMCEFFLIHLNNNLEKGVLIILVHSFLGPHSNVISDNNDEYDLNNYTQNEKLHYFFSSQVE